MLCYYTYLTTLLNKRNDSVIMFTTKQTERSHPMSTIISQTIRFRESVVKYAIKHNNNSKAAAKYNLTREYVRFWRNRYDGTIQSLMNKSKAPINPFNKQSDSQLDIVKHTYKYNIGKQAIEMFIIAQRKGYLYSYFTFIKTIKRLFANPSLKVMEKYVPKKYHTPDIPGTKVQCDVKYVPNYCYDNDEQRWCQYTFIDETTRIRYLHPAKESNSYESVKALDAAIIFFAKLGIKILEIQTDNGPEFTYRLLSEARISNFEQRLIDYGIRFHPIKPYTPRHNGKVERSHRNDNERFYFRKQFSSFEDYIHKLGIHNKNYNNFPIITLGFKSPKDYYNSIMKNIIS